MTGNLSTLGPSAKIVALTAGMINRGLTDLQQAYRSNLLKLHYSDDQLGDIDLDLHAPQLLLEDKNNIYLLFGIKFGSLRTKQPLRDISLEGWTFAHKIDKEILLSFAGPLHGTGFAENLSIERIFAALISSANNGFQPDPLLSRRDSAADLLNEKCLTWQEWSETSPDDWKWAKTVFEELPKRYNAGGACAIGCAIKLPESPEPQLNRLNLGITKENISILDYVRTNSSATDDGKARQLNSILVSGQTDVTTVETAGFSSVLYSTNFVSQAMNKAVTKVETGFWTLNGRDLLENLILPKLCIMNEVSVLKTGPAIWTDHGNGTKQYEPSIQVERVFSSIEDNPAPRMGYLFSKANDINGAQTGFRWDWSMDVPEVQTDKANEAGKSHRYRTSSSSSATATWSQTQLRDHIKCEYTTKYFVDSTWAPSAKWEEATNGAQFTFVVRYHFFIKFEVLEGGKLKVTLVSIPYDTKTEEAGAIIVGVIDDTSFGSTEAYEIDFYENLEAYIDDNMRPSIREASRHLRDWFDRNMVFTIDPESNWINFVTQPHFNSCGDMVIGIQYKAPSNISGFLTPYLAPRKPSENGKEPTQKVETKPTTKLVWTNDFFQDPDDEDAGILQLIGTNSSQLPVSLGYVIITIKSGTEDRTIAPELGETEVVPLLFSAKVIKPSAVALINPPGEPEIETFQSPTDKQSWDVRVPPTPEEDQAPELAVFRVKSGETIEITIQARCEPQKWTTGTQGAVLGLVTVKEAWKDLENARVYTGDGEVVVKVTSKL